MNYKNIYQSIISRAKSENRRKYFGTYFESHHILPKSIGGSNESDNLVLLTAKEHFVCHHLLYKIHGVGPMANAFWLMSKPRNSHCEKYHVSARIFEQGRIAHAERTRQIHTGKVVSQETRNKQSLAKRGVFDGDKNPNYGKPGAWQGKKRPSHSAYMSGKNNPSSGTCYVYSLEQKQSLRIPKKQLNHYIKEGWTKGRKMKF